MKGISGAGHRLYVTAKASEPLRKKDVGSECSECNHGALNFFMLFYLAWWEFVFNVVREKRLFKAIFSSFTQIRKAVQQWAYLWRYAKAQQTVLHAQGLSFIVFFAFASVSTI